MASNRTGNSRSTAGSKSTSSRRGRTSRGAERSFLDERSTRDIIGVVLSGSAIALMIAVAGDQSGIVTRWLSDGLRYGVGIGAYLVPIGLLLWGVSFFVRVEMNEARTGSGLGLVVLAVISLSSLSTPGARFLESEAVRSHGGYVGGAFSAVLHGLVGTAISAVILVVLLIVGLIITGLSVSDVIDRLRARGVARGERTAAESKTAPVKRTRASDGKSAGVEGGSAREAVTTAIPRRDKGAVDPESARRTAPAPKAVAPRALEGFVLPPVAVLKRTAVSAAHHKSTDAEQRTTAAMIAETLATFDIPARVVDWIAGPTVTLFEVEIAKGVRLNRITALADDIALSLAASTVRILAPIPGKALVGIEVPNERRSSVTLGDVLAPVGEGGPLLLGIGKDVSDRKSVV